MWRTRGDILLGVVILLVLFQETLGFAGITWAFALAVLQRGQHELQWWLLVGVLIMAIASTALLFGYMVAFHIWSDSEDRRHGRLLKQWAEVWAGALTGTVPELPKRIPAEATQSLLRLGDALTGEEHVRVRQLARDSGIERRALKYLEGRSLARKMEALDVIALGRLDAGFGHALVEIANSHRGLSMMGARACARTVAILDPSVRREKTQAFIDALAKSRLSEGAMRECLLLTEEAAPDVVAQILAAPPANELVLSAAVETVGHLQIRECASALGRILGRGPEVRASVLRAVTRLRLVPPELAPSVVGLMKDPAEFVRAHAARVSALMPNEAVFAQLWDGLGDTSWWVRRAASQALLEMGAPGRDMLARAAKEHPDRYARQVAGIAGGTLAAAEAA